MKVVKAISLLLVIIGGLNWLLVGVFDFNLVHFLFSKVMFIERLVYVLVGLAALVCIPMLKQICPYDNMD